MLNEQLIIFTDLDGTLLDLDTYSYKGAENALSEIREKNIPLIFCSSKTRTEQEFYRRRLDIHHPFIVENGGAIFIKRDYFNFEYEYQKVNANYVIIQIGTISKKIREPLNRIRKEYELRFKGYGDMSVHEVSDLTGLDREAARRAMTREYSETITFTGSELQMERFKKALQKDELQCSHGGRFFTITAASNDKGKAVEILKNLYRKAFGSIKTVGIGDAMNDLPLLAAVDLPILLQRPEEDWRGINLPGLRMIAGSGPAVWGGVISELLESETDVRNYEMSSREWSV